MKMLFFFLLIILVSAAIGLISHFRKRAAHPPASETYFATPYKDSAMNQIYNLLFCDNIDLYKKHTQATHIYPFDVLFSDTSSVSDLQKIIDDKESEPRTRLLAYRRQMAIGQTPDKSELLAVIVEVGLDSGLDVLASFKDGTARYINQSGKLIVWETTADGFANKLTADLFAASQAIVNQIGIGDHPRRSYPLNGNARITFLLSNGSCFGEGLTDALFNEPVARPALTKATELMQYLIEKSSDENR